MFGSHNKSKEESFKEFVRNYFKALEMATGNLQYNFIALKKILGVTDEQMDKALFELHEELEKRAKEAEKKAAETNEKVKDLLIPKDQ